MSSSKELRQIHRALEGLPTGRRRRIPDQVRRWISDYARRQMADGWARSAVAKELGVSDPTLTRLLRQQTSPGLLPVRVMDELADSGPVVVRLPGGLVVEGLDVQGLIALIRGLS
jgi:AraC-like DNA-binding protein